MERHLIYKGKRVPFSIWRGERMGRMIALDTETTLIKQGEVPRLIVGSVFDGKDCYVIMADAVESFLNMHRGCRWLFHSAAFDIAVTEKHCGFWWYDLVDTGKVLDIAILYRLVGLAETGNVPDKYNLDLMSIELLHEKLDKNEAIRCTFDGKLTDAHLAYAAKDAVVTYHCAMKMLTKAKELDAELGVGKLLGHRLQLQASIAYAATERQGVRVDLARAKVGKGSTEQAMGVQARILADYGYYVARKGQTQAYNRIMDKVAADAGVKLPLVNQARYEQEQPEVEFDLFGTDLSQTREGDVTTKEECLAPVANHPFVAAFIEYGRLQKLNSTFFNPLVRSGGIVYPRYDLIKETGRVSCRKPNLQFQPREGGVRECILPRDGCVFIASDYSFIELCTLAQVMYEMFGKSLLRDIINSGKDPHMATAALMAGKEIEAVVKSERQGAKVVNFGVPGGMRGAALAKSGRASYGVDWSDEEGDAMRERFLSIYPDINGFLNCHGKVVVTPSGRVRTHVTSNQYHNTFFQGRAADGIKLAQYRLFRQGLITHIPIHDELILEVADDNDMTEKARLLDETMISSMRHYCPDVEIKAEAVAMNRWLKGAEDAYERIGRLDANGRLNVVTEEDMK